MDKKLIGNRKAISDVREIKNFPEHLKFLNQKQGISDVVTNVLLILISVVAVVMLAAFIIPMIKNKLNDTCSIEMTDYLGVVDSDYSCSNSSYTSVMIERGVDNLSMAGFQLSILAGGSSKSYRITGNSSSGVRMLNNTGGLTANLEIPLAGESRTYVFDLAGGEKATLGLITDKNKVCETDNFLLPGC